MLNVEGVGEATLKLDIERSIFDIALLLISKTILNVE